MHDHREILALAAAAIDFELDAGGALAARRRPGGLPPLPPAGGRDARHRHDPAAALRHRNPEPRPRCRHRGRSSRRPPDTRPCAPSLAASLTLLVVLGGTAVLVGNRGFGLLPTRRHRPRPRSRRRRSGEPVRRRRRPRRRQPIAHRPAARRAPAIADTAPPAPVTTACSSGRHRGHGQRRTARDPDAAGDGRRLRDLQDEALPGSARPDHRGACRGVRLSVVPGPARRHRGVGRGCGSRRRAVAGSGPQRADRVRAGCRRRLGRGHLHGRSRRNGRRGSAARRPEPDPLRATGLVARRPAAGLRRDARRLGQRLTEIFVVDADGSNLLQITQNEVDDDSPAWSPDSTQIAFRQADPDPSAPVDSNVVLVRADGSGRQGARAGREPGLVARRSAARDDGLRTAAPPASGCRRPTAAGRRQVSDVSIASAPPAWSPDGQHLVVSSSGLFLVEVASGSITPLTAEPGSMPTWSTGGRSPSPRPARLRRASSSSHADGSGLRRVSGDPSFARGPRWSPDGRWLLLGGEGGSPVGIVDPGSGNLTVLWDRHHNPIAGLATARLP